MGRVTALAVHAHFYQPAREDPASGRIPPEASAAPFENWNRRITAECYRPNAELGNFEGLSFDLGPTLGAWLEREAPEVHRRIVAADRENLRRHGCGNALAQPYHHTILPLATRAEKEIEVAWGIADFEHRFGRRPRGMWLPETAADTETLQVLAEAGIEYTVLAPWQTEEEDLDPSRPYWIELPGGRRVAAFFFHRELSGRLAFDPEVTADADAFAAELLAPARPAGDDRLLLLASDGELYGHHQEFRDLFLARLLGGAAEGAGFAVTHLERWLVAHPPRRAVRIERAGSWSCHHGVERWAGECECCEGDTSWKAPLRRGLERLAAGVDEAFTAVAARWAEDPRELLRRYVEVVLGSTSAPELVARLVRRRTPAAERERLRLLLEAQRLRLRMFASCIWFGGEVDRVELRHGLAAAAGAAALVERATGRELAGQTLAGLSRVPGGEAGVRAGEVLAAALKRRISTEDYTELMSAKIA